MPTEETILIMHFTGMRTCFPQSIDIAVAVTSHFCLAIYPSIKQLGLVGAFWQLVTGVLAYCRRAPVIRGSLETSKSYGYDCCSGSSSRNCALQYDTDDTVERPTWPRTPSRTNCYFEGWHVQLSNAVNERTTQITWRSFSVSSLYLTSSRPCSLHTGINPVQCCTVFQIHVFEIPLKWVKCVLHDAFQIQY